MEQREDFKRVVEGINQLEQQLLSIVEDGKVNDKDFAEAEEEVERYFSRCEQALAARKEGLLRELAQKLTDQSMSSSILLPSPLLCLPSTQKGKAVMDAQEEVNMAIKARKKMLKAGSYVYKIDIKSAENTWKVWSSSLLSHIALSLLLSHDFSPPLLPTTAVSFSTLWTHLFECREPPICHGLKPQWEGWSWTSPAHSLVSLKHLAQVYHLTLHSQNGHKWLTLFHHLSCAAAGWQARPSSGDRVQIFDCK